MSKNENYYVVQYNDRYGNGDDKVLEVIVRTKTDFKEWLKIHNKNRKENGDMKESAEEFTLIPITLFET